MQLNGKTVSNLGQYFSIQTTVWSLYCVHVQIERVIAFYCIEVGLKDTIGYAEEVEFYEN